MFGGSDTLIHWAGWAMVFIGLIVLNEVGRRTKLGAAIIFGVAPLAMTIYCVAIAIGVSQGAEWALTNPTHVYQNSWFHYAKVYAALAGCWGFIAIKYQWGKDRQGALVPRMAVCDRRHQHLDRRRVRLRERLSLLCPGRVHLGHLRRCHAAGRLEQRVQRHRRSHQHLLHDRLVERLRLRGSDRHAVARHDLGLHHRLRYLELLLHLQLPAHPLHGFCGFALLLAPTVAAFIWNKGGWIQNRAFTLAIWCMFARVFPYFREESIFVTHSTLDPGAATAVSIAALIANVAAIIYIAYRAKKLGRNPYKQDVFEGTSDWEKATARRAKVDYAHAEVTRWPLLALGHRPARELFQSMTRRAPESVSLAFRGLFSSRLHSKNTRIYKIGFQILRRPYRVPFLGTVLSRY